MNYKNFTQTLLYNIIENHKKEIPKENRTTKNIPRYSTGKPKISYQEWLGIKGNGGQGYDGKFYGWSHRAIYGFGVGDTISGDSMAHVDYKWKDSDDGIKRKPYIIKTEKEAKEHAIRFMKAVS